MKKLTEDQIRDVVALYQSGLSAASVAERFPVTTSAIKGLLSRRGLLRSVGDVPRKDSFIHNYSVDEIKDALNECGSLRKAAIKLGAGHSVVSRLCHHHMIAVPERIESLRRVTAVKIKDGLFDGKLNRDQSWLLGLLMTDGCVTSGNSVSVALMDKDAIECVARIMECGNVRHMPPRPPRTVVDMWGWYVCSKVLADRLSTYGVTPRKTFTLQWPQKPLSVDVQAFVLGLWDGDGCWGIDRRDGSLTASFGSASKDFIADLHRALKEVTGSKSCVRQVKDTFWTISYHGNPAEKLRTWLYDGKQPYLQRKAFKASRYRRHRAS